MADPLKIIRSLETLTTGYTVFEPDQVLTEKQLNGLANYLDDQDRLTRVELLGVGIVGGLRVKIDNGKVRVGKGVGVTTDGDLLVLPADASFDRIKPYDTTAPVYPPFYNGSAMLTIFELVREGESDVRAKPMSSLPFKLADMAVLMLMESYQKDQDLCSGTDCDNLGKDAINNTRLLLVSLADAKRLLTLLPNDSAASLQLPELLADRPQIAGAIATTGALAVLYRNACNNIHASLTGNLAKLYASLPGLVGDLFNGDPSPAWIATLGKCNAQFSSQDIGIQYYYDFLKDLVETWNALRDVVFDDDSVLCPDVTAFPKHLLLGALANPVELRTGLYPSPLLGNGSSVREHARFLAWKLHILINTFVLPSDTTITVTPSSDEATPLENRAIPYYYAYQGELPIQRGWNYRLSMRSAESRNLGYRAAAYGGNVASAATLNPFGYQIGRYDFFRIEGHLGQNVSAAVRVLRNLIATKNLPIALRAILLHNDPLRIIYKPPIRFGDLHRIHYLLRNEVDTQLARSSGFSQAFKAQVQGAAYSTEANKAAAANYDTTIGTAIAESRKSLTSPSYTSYRAAPAWNTYYSTAVDNASKFKQDFGAMVRTDFQTTFDTFIGSNHANWIDWLDILIDHKNSQEDNKLLFQNFIKQHAGLEHGGGVPRGGTFVLVYDDKGNVVADFALPYYDDEIIEDEPVLPTLPPHAYVPPYLLTGGFTLIQPIDSAFASKLGDLQATIEGDWQKNVSIQQDYLKFFTTTVGALGNISSSKNGAPVVNPAYSYTDARLGMVMTTIETYTHQVEAARAVLMQPDAPEETRKAAGVQLQQAESSLATAIVGATQYMADNKVAVSAGGDGATALAALAGSMDKVSSPEALGTLKVGLARAQTSATGAQLNFVSNLIQMKGFGG
jgi:hypothetical protein